MHWSCDSHNLMTSSSILMGQFLELLLVIRYICTSFIECFFQHGCITQSSALRGGWCRYGGRGSVDWGGWAPTAPTGRRAEQRVQYPLSLPASRQTFKSGLRYYNKEGLCRNNAEHFNLKSNKVSAAKPAGWQKIFCWMWLIPKIFRVSTNYWRIWCFFQCNSCTLICLFEVGCHWSFTNKDI